MEILGYMVIALIIGVSDVVCLLIGARLGRAIDKGDAIPSPIKDVTRAVKTAKADKAAKRDLDRYEKILQNIDRYDGTSSGQVDV